MTLRLALAALLLVACGGDPLADADCGLPPHVRQSNVINGACVAFSCETGYEDCNQTFADGCEADLAVSPNCGACGRGCISGTSCQPYTYEAGGRTWNGVMCR